jgi:hypothetical protein
MKRAHIAPVLAMLATTVLTSTNIRADEWDKKTIVTFNKPVEIPGRVLEAGTYVFKLLDSQSERHVVQVFDKGQDKLLATILAISDYRTSPADKTIINFEERSPGSPEAVKEWFYPGDNFGQLFVYPKAKAAQLAVANNQPVPAMPDAMEQHITKPAASVTEPPVVELKMAPITVATAKGTEVPVEVAFATQLLELPRTASNTAFVALAGAMLLALAVLTRFVSRA